MIAIVAARIDYVTARQIKSPLEADIDIAIPADQANGSLAEVVGQHGL